ncbi:MAG TPA: aminopeptidase N [Rhizomicrobium sp.]|jgi:aminopeptidase N
MRTEEPRAVRLKDYRPPDYRVREIALDFSLDPEATRVKARLAVERTSAGPAPLVLDGEALKLVSIAIDGRGLNASEYVISPETLIIHAPPERFALEIETEFAPAQNTTLEGLYVSKGIFCTQCEAEGFRRITYFLDRPDVLAVYTTRIEADSARFPVLLSNGNPVERGDLPGGRHFAVWQDPFPKPCYLFALVAGNLGHIADEFFTRSGRRVALRIYVEHGNEPRALYAMDSLKRAMRWDEETYGREYDLDTFMIVAVSAFNFGAMENKGLNIFNDKVLLASPETATDDDYARIEGVVAHEYFHNWSGNRVTCRDWFQLSLKEGLTVFRDQSFSADMRSAAVKRIEDVRLLRLRQFPEDAGPLAHPVQPQAYITIDNFYTATVYEKGAEVIGMLKTLVGEDAYRKATDLYFARHDGHAATVEDWVQCFEDVTGRDLAQFRLWYEQSGTPVVEARGDYDREQETFTLTLRQQLRATPGHPHNRPMQIPLRVGLVGENGRALPLTLEGENAIGPEERVLELGDSEQCFAFVNVPEPPLLSIGRSFSAPVVLRTSAGRAEHAALMARDCDGFNRWESGQTLARDVLLEMVRQALAGRAPEPDPVLIDAMGMVLDRAEEDHAFAAQMLAPPLESELAQAIEPADPEAIHAARTALVRAIAISHEETIRRLYRLLEDTGPFQTDAKAAGRRALRNVCLRYLTAADDESAARMAESHYRVASNMTDMIAGLGQLSRMDFLPRNEIFAHFHNRFRDDALVLDKWFALQAMSPLPETVHQVRELMRHPSFDLRNPNRVRALIGAFSANHLRFHSANGQGYALVGETLRELDSINPQVAARMAGAFENWRRYDVDRQALMRRELEAMLAMPERSSNMFEVASKMLG